MVVVLAAHSVPGTAKDRENSTTPRFSGNCYVTEQSVVFLGLC